MLQNEFSESTFTAHDDKQNSLLENIKQLRVQLGLPDRAKILKALERTKPYTRTVYPNNWNNN